ncbi:MAG: hypothetical protein WKF31_13060 [Thermoleophilaceae bacterium]
MRTPILYDVELWKRSGHWEKYKDNMYFTDGRGPRDGAQADELPGPRADLRRRAPLLSRPPASPLGGRPRAPPRGERRSPRSARVRAFTQDDARIFCTEEQIEDEVLGCLGLSGSLPVRGLRVRAAARASRRARSSASAPTRCGTAPSGPSSGLSQRRGLAVPTESEGDGAFYGPKIDFVT